MEIPRKCFTLQVRASKIKAAGVIRAHSSLIKGE